ncbi:MAG: cation acetate symporter [Nocardioides sp.]
MLSDTELAMTGVALVSVLTLAIGAWATRLSRTTSDFFVASRSVSPWLNASAIGGEYLSAASFLGVAGLLLAYGTEMLWYPVGWTAGYLVLLVLVAAPLRRSGAYTLPDFAEARLRSGPVRGVSSLLVVGIGWLYLIPQFQGADLTLGTATGLDIPGGLIVAAVVLLNVVAGGMRSVTFVQAFQYWFKLTALLVPAVWLLAVWFGDGRPSPWKGPLAALGSAVDNWGDPLSTTGSLPLYTTYSLIVATFCGTMALPHVAVRYYTNPDGRAARRTTVAVLGLLGLFYVLPPVYGALGRVYAPDLVPAGRTDAVVLELPARIVDGWAGQSLGALLVAGAFAAFLSTSSGLTVAVAGVLSQDVIGRWFGLRGIASFRVGAVVAIAAPFAISRLADRVGVATAVGLAFAVAASTFCPLLTLGIWWPRLTDAGALAGLAVGGLTSGAAAARTFVNPLADDSLLTTLSTQPALWTVPAAFVAMITVSLLTPHRRPRHVTTFMVRLHTPEAVAVHRG